jgi:DNA-binding response OmpR family regulator
VRSYPFSFKTIPVLIVDNDPILSDSFQSLLEDAGFFVVTAKTGSEALRKAEVVRFKLAIVNPQLNDICCEELSRRLKATIPGISVIILTLNPADRERMEEADATEKKTALIGLLRATYKVNGGV